MSLSIVYYANIVFIFYSSFISAKFFTTCRYLYNDRCLFNILHYYVSIFFVNLLTTYIKKQSSNIPKECYCFLFIVLFLLLLQRIYYSATGRTQPPAARVISISGLTSSFSIVKHLPVLVPLAIPFQ